MILLYSGLILYLSVLILTYLLTVTVTTSTVYVATPTKIVVYAYFLLSVSKIDFTQKVILEHVRTEETAKGTVH